jgi:hypothetical protein
MSGDTLGGLICLVTAKEVWSVWGFPGRSSLSGDSLDGLVFSETHWEVVYVL